MRPTPRTVPIGKALPILIPDTRLIIALCTIVLSIAAAYSWYQARTWSPRARAVAHVAGRALGWVLTSAGYVLRLLGLIIRAILWAASLLALLSIVGYALGLCGDGNRHYR